MYPELTKFEPHITATVRKSGDIYVGKKYAGRKAYVYFLIDNDDEKDE